MRAGLSAAIVIVVAAFGLSACGSRSVETDNPNATVNAGAKLFAERCAGCHQLDKAGTEGGALKVGDREKTDGPNFNVRKEKKEEVLYAIRNGGFSGAIMPENIVVGKDAEAVAAFLAEYSGKGKGN
ncbi:MAG TPA: c-type cytochrome [Baekduia sp.]|nr:c-type cytochrome [Baekduia sp.]